MEGTNDNLAVVALEVLEFQAVYLGRHSSRKLGVLGKQNEKNEPWKSFEALQLEGQQVDKYTHVVVGSKIGSSDASCKIEHIAK